MKLPEKAPQKIKNSLVFLQNEETLRETIRKANSEYLYWDRFKYLTLPKGVSPETAWGVLKIFRAVQFKIKSFAAKAFNYWLPDTAHAELHYIDQNASGQILLDESGLYGSKDKYVISSLMDEAIASSLIEGAATTRLKAKEMLRTGRTPTNHAEKMIYNNYVTITKIKDTINEPLSPQLLKGLHRSMTGGTLDDPSQEGRFRKEDERIEVIDEEGRVLYVPPPATEVEDMVAALCDFANKDDKEFIHPVIKGILLHFWLSYIHPFIDGNGRTARALFYWYMLKRKYWLFEYLSISRTILRARQQYYRSFLYTEMDDGDMTYFIMFHLHAIRLAINELLSDLREQQKELRSAVAHLSKYPHLNHRQRELLAHALKRPDAVYEIQNHMRIHGVVYQTARADLLELASIGLFKKVKRGRSFYFIPAGDFKERLSI